MRMLIWESSRLGAARLLLVACTQAVLPGCLAVVVGGAVAAGVGTAVYLNGELKSSESVGLSGAYQAFQTALEIEPGYALARQALNELQKAHRL